MISAKAKRVLATIIVTVILLVILLGSGLVNSAKADDLLQTDHTNSRQIAYPGYLTGEDGQAVSDGDYSFIFALYDDMVGGNSIWSEAHDNIPVHKGSFAVLLGSKNPLPETAFSTRAWLAVSVAAPQADNYVELSPRQLLDEVSFASQEAPDAAPACPHDHLYNEWVGTSTTYGIRIQNTGVGDGIRGISSSTLSSYAGLFGSNTAASGQGSGVYGRSVSSTGYGVYGRNSSTGIGVYGDSTDGVGVRGNSVNSFGVQANGNDLTGDDNFGDIWLEGERGEVLTGQRMNLISDWNINLDIDYDNDQFDAKFRIHSNASNTEVFSVDENGNMVATGTKSAVVQTADNGRRLLYAIESPEIWFEDIDSATLTDGKVEVQIEPVFAQTVNLTDYQVFLTPISDTPVLLYVTTKTPTSFTVMGVTLDGLVANCSFDYRIVAKRLGYENIRLEQSLPPEVEIK